jgi:hypothetical protein
MLYENPNTGKKYMRGPDDTYFCSTHSKSFRTFEKACSLHYIRTGVVRELVLTAIRRVSEYVRGNEEEFLRRVREESAVQKDEAAKAHRKRIARNKNRIAELDVLFRKTYEDNAVGKLSDERYEQLTVGYERETAELKEQNATLQAAVDAFDADSVRADRFVALVKRYSDFTELTAPMINEFIQKIVVHEADRSSGKRTQRVDIHFTFIGAFDVPLTLDEQAHVVFETERKLEDERAKRREYNRRYREKRKLEAAVPKTA